MSPDSVSSLFPDRPIRPLPKRRLRERLSPDVADTIKYPPAPQVKDPLFHYPYSLSETASRLSGRGSGWVDTSNSTKLDVAEHLQNAASRNGNPGVDVHQFAAYQARRTLVSRPLHDSGSHLPQTARRSNPPRHDHPQPPPSTSSSADGYDSFENTNNKKKRKIPTAGEASLNGAHVLSDSGILGMPSPPATGDEASDVPGGSPTPYYQMAGNMASTQGISGPGRGRYGRVRNGRSPLRALPDPNFGWTGRNAKIRPTGQEPTSPTGENSGIISSAIASAEKLPATHGQENISLLHQQASSKASPASSHFTFTFDSQVPGTVSWPGSDPTPSHMARRPGPPGRRDLYGAPARAGPAGQSHAQSLGPSVSVEGKGTPQTGTSTKKTRRRRGNSLMLAAKHRRQETAYQNFHHPPPPEEVWICEFCEYESIFGRPPEALIRQYEIKDRRRRREEAERRRLLEKAKMKSRKGKKASKAAAKNSGPVQDRNPVAPSPAVQPGMAGHDPSQETQSEEFDEDEYYEDDLDDDEIPQLIPSHDAYSQAAPTPIGAVEGARGQGGGGQRPRGGAAA